MKIASNMNLHHLAEHLGDIATEEDAAAVRDVLVEKFDGMDTADVSDAEFWSAVDEAMSE